jgi:hypothetical protein
MLEVPSIPSAEEGNSEDSDKLRSEDKEIVKCLYYGKSPCADILVKANDKGVAVLEVSGVPYGSISFGQDAPAGQVQYSEISFDCWFIPAFTNCQECSVVMPADMEAALL